MDLSPWSRGLWSYRPGSCGHVVRSPVVLFLLQCRRQDFRHMPRAHRREVLDLMAATRA
jgi:hypothetical protein